jgi:hypothetical protein
LPLSKADDAGWIIVIARVIAKRPATGGMFGPMSGWVKSFSLREKVARSAG